jgi:uncharacterized protein (DUF58 family)
MAENKTGYLHPHTLAAVGSVELRARMAVEGLMTGMHKSPMHGISVEFAQHRPYTPGDEPRFIDWKVYAKTDKLYLKQFQKETNLDLVIMVDVSGSMAYGSEGPSDRGTKGPREEGGNAGRAQARADAGGQEAGGKRSASATRPLGHSAARWRKFDHAATVAAAMSYLALQQQDRVGLYLFDEQIERATRLSNARDHWRSISEVLDNAALSTTDPPAHSIFEQDEAELSRQHIAKVFDSVVAKLSQRSLVVIVSDLFDDTELLEKALARLHHRRHDVIVMQTLDPAELQFSFRQPTEFLGLEGEGRLPLDPAALREAYLEAMNQHLREVERIARQFRFDHLLLNTSQPLGPPLSHFLADRAARIARG